VTSEPCGVSGRVETRRHNLIVLLVKSLCGDVIMRNRCLRCLVCFILALLVSCTRTPENAKPIKDDPAADGKKNEPVAEVPREPFLQAYLKGNEDRTAPVTWEIKARNLKKLTARMMFFAEGKITKEKETVLTLGKWDKPAADDVIGTIQLKIEPPDSELPKDGKVKYSLSFNFDKAPAHERKGDKDMTLDFEWRVGQSISTSENISFQAAKKNQPEFLYFKIGRLTKDEPGRVYDIQKEVPVRTIDRVRQWSSEKGRQAVAMTVEIE
jgi:hypothetical protein